MTTVISGLSLDKLERYLLTHPERANKALVIALNDGAKDGMPSLRAAVAEDVNFPPGYVNNDRLGITSRATPSRLEVVITARQRATSLIRFSRDATFHRKGAARPQGVSVEVHRGAVKKMRNAFPVRLRRGASLTSDNFNLGLAMRLKPGETISNKKTAVQLDRNVVLMYGPSVDQVFRDVAADPAVVDPVLDRIENEFLRQYQRLGDL